MHNIERKATNNKRKTAKRYKNRNTVTYILSGKN